jgi:hypothetical protein
VLVSFDGTADDPGALVLPTTASLDHATACDDSGCAHGFEVAIPWSLRDGEPHEVHVATVDGSPLAEASEVACAADLDGLRLRPIDAAGVSAWGFDPALDVLALSGIDVGDDEPFPAAPLLVRADNVAGTWWIDAGQRRAVEPDAAAAWGLSVQAAMTWPDGSVQDVPIGPPLPPWRRATQIDGKRYVVDVPAVAGPGGGDDSGSGADAGDSAGGGGAGDGDGATTGEPDAEASEGDDDGGCRIGGDPRFGAGSVWLLLGGWLLRRPRSRRGRG